MHLPSDLEAALIKDVIKGVDTDLEYCDAEISSLTSALEGLKKRKAHLQSVKDNYRTLLAPVRKLPVEILLEIFSLLCTKSPGLSVTSACRRSLVCTPTLDIASTCNHWRKIALSNPSLWSNISIDLAYRGLSIPDLVKLYLQRSKSVLLTLTITAFRLDHNTMDDDDRHLKELSQESWEILRSILDEMPRWSRASFDLSTSIYRSVDEWAYHGWEEDIPDHPSPNLTHLRLAWEDESGSGDEGLNDFFHKFRSASKLRVLQVPCFQSSFPLPFEKIVEAKLLYHSGHQMRAFLQRCSRLKVLSISQAFWAQKISSDRPIVSHILESITINLGRLDSKLGKTLSSLDLPNLTSLSLSREPFSNDDAESQRNFSRSLKQMLDKSQRILSLTLDGFLLSDQDLITILPQMKCLRELVLMMGREYNCILTNAFVRALYTPDCDTESPSGLVDGLNHLEFHFKECYFYNHRRQQPPDLQLVEPELLITMLESRRSSLRHFELHGEIGSPYSAEWLENFAPEGRYRDRLFALHANGLRITTASTEGDRPLIFLQDESDDD